MRPAPVGGILPDMTSINRTPGFANVTSVLALVVALGGTSYAAVQLPKNSVGSKQIKTGAVLSAEVRNGSLRVADFKSRERRKLKGAPGTARAYGVISSSGTLVAARSKNVTARALGSLGGFYCVTPTATSGINPAKSLIVATPDYDTSGTAGLNHIVQTVDAPAGHPDCPGGYFLITKNFNDDTNSFTEVAMAVSFVIP